MPSESIAEDPTLGDVRVEIAPVTAAEFRDLYDETGWGAWTLDRFEAAIAGSWLVCGARDADGRLVGMARLISDGVLHAFVTEMIVTEEARGRGIGARILATLVAAARERGVDDVQLFAARGRAEFYARNGFTRRSDDAPGMDAVPSR